MNLGHVRATIKKKKNKAVTLETAVKQPARLRGLNTRRKLELCGKIMQLGHSRA